MRKGKRQQNNRQTIVVVREWMDQVNITCRWTLSSYPPCCLSCSVFLERVSMTVTLVKKNRHTSTVPYLPICSWAFRKRRKESHYWHTLRRKDDMRDTSVYRAVFVPSCCLSILYILLLPTPTSSQDATPHTDWTFSEFIPETYDRTQSPLHPDHHPINVSISMKIMQILSVRESEQSLTIDLMYTQRWPDHRLKFPPISNETIPMDLTWKDKLWIPVVYLANSVEPPMLRIAPLFLEIEANTSQLILTTRQVVKLRCLMDLFRFPADTQTCSVEFTLRKRSF